MEGNILMKIDDDTVRAYYATRDLLRLYGVYQSTTRAQIAATQQIRRHVAGRKSKSNRALTIAQLDRQEMLFWHTDAVLNDRREQVRRRLFELLELPQLP